jgi:hypothetical protein
MQDKKIKVDYVGSNLKQHVTIKNAAFVAAAVIMSAGNVSASL